MRHLQEVPCPSPSHRPNSSCLHLPFTCGLCPPAGAKRAGNEHPRERPQLRWQEWACTVCGSPASPVSTPTPTWIPQRYTVYTRGLQIGPQQSTGVTCLTTLSFGCPPFLFSLPCFPTSVFWGHVPNKRLAFKFSDLLGICF